MTIVNNLGEGAPEKAPAANQGQPDGADETTSYPFNPGDENFTDQIAQMIVRKHAFARDGFGRLHVFRNGAYRPDGVAVILREVKAILKQLKMTSKWTSHKAKEVVSYVDVDAPELWDRPPLDWVNVENGLLHLDSRTLHPHSPLFRSPIQLPVRYDPEAKCPNWGRFIFDVFPSDAVRIAYQIVALLLTPDTHFQKAFLLLGDGANGKSVFLKALIAFLGLANVTSVPLQSLEKDRFAISRLAGRLANICGDLSSEDLASTAMFKSIVGGDTVQGERKFENAFEFTPYARLIFAANHLPRSRDASQAFYRRLVIILFDRVFDQNAPGTLHPDVLHHYLTQPSELSGLLNRALDELPHLRTSGLLQCESLRFAAEEHRKATDPLSQWLDGHVQADPSGMVPVDTLWRLYVEDCAAKGRPTRSKTALGKTLRSHFPAMTRVQRSIEGKTIGCYEGITLVSAASRETAEATDPGAAQPATEPN